MARNDAPGAEIHDPPSLRCAGAAATVPIIRRSRDAGMYSERDTTPVDDVRIDRLARLLGARAPRRVGPAALLAALSATASGGSTAGVRGKPCLRNGRRCGRRGRTPGKGGTPCRYCCSGYARRKRCACRGSGVSCNRLGQCCSGECVQGTCSNTCIALNGACDPKADLCCRSGAVCEDAAGADGPHCCLPAGFPCDRPAECCNGICDHDSRRCLVFDPE